MEPGNAGRREGRGTESGSRRLIGVKAFLQLGLNVAQYLPAVLSGVVAVESAIGSEAPGTAKKQIVADAITALAKVGEASSNPNVSVISTLIDSTVATLNATGLFKKAAPAAAAPAPDSAA